MSSYIWHSNLQIRANVTQSRRKKLWKIRDLERIGKEESAIWKKKQNWKLGVRNLNKESKFTEAHWINVIMFCPYFAVLRSLHSAGAGFFFGGGGAKGDFDDVCAWPEKKKGCPHSPLHVPISLSITTNQKFKTCTWHKRHVLGLKTPIYF